MKQKAFFTGIYSLSRVLNKLPAIAAAVIFLSCLQADYEEPILDYIPPPAGDVVSGLFSVTGSDMLIVTINGGTFQERLSDSLFVLNKGDASVPLNMPLRDSENRVIFSFGSGALGDGSNYRLTVLRGALKNAVSRVTVQAVKGGVWESASDIQGAFGSSLIWSIAYGNGRFIAVADEGKMAYSNDGVDWTAIRPGYSTIQSQFDKTIRGIAWGNGQFIAVGYDGRMAASDNGMNWNGWTESIVGGNSLLCVTYGGGRFVAGGDNGRILYMQDGGSWNRAGDSRFGDKSIIALVWGNPSGKNVYVAAGKDGQLSWSNDAFNWTYSDAGFGGQNIYGLAWGNDYFVAVGDSGRIARSTDGNGWQFVNSPFGSSGIQSVVFGSGTFIAVGHDGKMATSTDGETWTLVPGNIFASNWQVKAVGYGGGKFVAAGHPYTPETGCRIVYSYQPPQVITPPADKNSDPFNSKAGDNRLVISLNGGKFSESVSINHFTVFGGMSGIGSGAVSGVITERGDTRVVIRLNSPVVSNGTGQQIRVNKDAFVLQPSSMQVIAEKALTWSLASSNPFDKSNISAIAYNGSKYVAVGAGKIAASTDGKSWSEIGGTEKGKWANDNDYVFFRDIVYGNGKFVAVGYWVNGGGGAGWGVAAVSTDGASWTLPDKTLTFDAETISPQVYAVTHNGETGASSRFIAAGQWGRTAWSTDGSSWTPVQITSFNYLDNPGKFEDVLSIAYGGGIFVAVGGNGKVAYSTDGSSSESWKWAANTLLGDGVNINTICFGNGIFIAAGNGGNMKIVSADKIAPATGSVNGGDNWQGVNSKFSTSHIFSVAHNGITGAASKFIAAGDDGKISESSNSESSDGVNWLPILPGSGADQNKFNDRERVSRVFWGGGKFIAGGFAYLDNTSKLTYSE